MWQDYIEKYKDKKVKLIVAGSRGFTDSHYAFRWLDHLLQSYDKSEIVILDGKAKGADKIGGDYGRERGIDVWDFVADWKNLDVAICKVGTNAYGDYNKLAGLQRNEDMGNNGTHLLAFNLGTSGTTAMVKYANKKGLVVKEVKL